ncbi:DELTA-sagatoxin-Srs1a-like [Sphaeramia orbicularis]|nr:DELTA-sagatoxin-Srs1a-like [Sphaeramia orbicularis]XP_029977996.1 DELTA-sagatoxin-Srs1a-like [Sphaeramia orbicularis]XP_029977997.1 DELTA-sagatoxin-Srs1a-like [Sphaeramia orbicularis]
MPETAEAHSAHLTTNRNCTVEVTNVTSRYCLTNPKVYMESGFNFSPPQPTVRSTMTEVCSFTKDDNTATGAAGVFTYEMYEMQTHKCTEVLAVMFSVPFDFNIYSNWLGLGIFDRSKACDEKLFNSMYHDKDCVGFVRQKSDGSGLLYTGSTVDLRATMSSEGKAIIKLEVYDRMSR